MSYRRKQPGPFDPNEKIGVNFFKHKAKGLMPPNGKAASVMTDTEILDKCTLWTSEWLTRLHIAMSEFSSSVYENLLTVKQYEDKVFARAPVTYLVNKIRPLKNALQRFNKKGNIAEEPDSAVLCQVMKTLNEPNFVTMTKELFAAGAALSHGSPTHGTTNAIKAPQRLGDETQGDP